VPRERPGDEPTTAIAAQRPQDPESTEKLNIGEKEKKKQERRRGGGLSAQDLLRREGRL
jgi:RND superfamily putative drug exporter